MSRKFKEFYEMQDITTGRGVRQEPVYKGAYHRFLIADKARARYGALFLSLSLANMGLFLSAGMLNGIFSRTIYVTVPYAIQFLPAMFLISSSFGFMRSRGDLTVPDYRMKFIRIKTMGYINLLMSSITVAECALLLFFRRVESGINEVLFVLFMVLIGAVLAVILVLHQKIEKLSEIIEDNQNKMPDENI